MTVDVARSAFTRAVTVVVPGPIALTTPSVTTATDEFDEVHSTPVGAWTGRPSDVAESDNVTELAVGIVLVTKIVTTGGDSLSVSPGGAFGSVSESLEQARPAATTSAPTAMESRAERMDLISVSGNVTTAAA
jgi:hypothetical protein